MLMFHAPAPYRFGLLAILVLGIGIGCEPAGDAEADDAGGDPAAVADAPPVEAPAGSSRPDDGAAPPDPPGSAEAPSQEEADAGGQRAGVDGVTEDGDAAQDGGVEAAMAEVDAMVQRARFTEAYQQARALQRRFQDHPRRQAIDRLVARLAGLNREARGLDRLIDKLDATDTEVRHIARARIRRAGEAGLIALRHAARTREDATAIEAAELLASMGDPQAGPLFARRLREEVAPALHRALASRLGRVAPDADPTVLKTLLPIVEGDAAHERLVIAGYLIETAAEAAGQDPARWAELFDSDGAYATIRRYVRQALEQSDRPELIAWASDHALPLAIFESGLRAELFNDTDLSRRVGSRLVKRVSHDKNSSPIEGLPGQSIAARWTGQLLVPRDGRYTLYTSTDDGVRLWIDGERVVNEWRGRAEEEDRASMDLTAGLHDIRLEWYQGGGDYAVHLRWEGPGIEKQVIGPEHLRTIPWAGMDRDLDD